MGFDFFNVSAPHLVRLRAAYAGVDRQQRLASQRRTCLCASTFIGAAAWLRVFSQHERNLVSVFSVSFGVAVFASHCRALSLSPSHLGTSPA